VFCESPSLKIVNAHATEEEGMELTRLSRNSPNILQGSPKAVSLRDKNGSPKWSHYKAHGDIWKPQVEIVSQLLSNNQDLQQTPTSGFHSVHFRSGKVLNH